MIRTLKDSVGDRPLLKIERVGYSHKVRVGDHWAWPGMKLRATPFSFDSEKQALTLAELMKADEVITTKYRYVNP